MNYFKLFGYKTLLLIAATQIIIKYFLFKPFDIAITLNGFGFFLLVLASLALAAAGKVIQSIVNVDAEAINRPKKVVVGKSISEKRAYNLFAGLSILGVGIGFYLSNSIGYPAFSALAIVISGVFYVHAVYLKKLPVVDNLVVAILAAMVVIVLGIYDLLPAITPKNIATQQTIFSILLDYALFVFLMVWLLEMVKDQENMDGDHKANNNSLSVSLGKDRVNNIIFGLCVFPLAAVIYYLYEYLFGALFIVLYCLLFVLAPLLYFLLKILSAKSKKDFSRLRWVLTFVFWTASISIGLYQFVLL